MTGCAIAQMAEANHKVWLILVPEVVAELFRRVKGVLGLNGHPV
jgi:hypothetical protein